MVEIIAEIGVNHNGDEGAARELIEAARDAGCDTVKFQLWDSERVYPRERWYEMQRLELSRTAIARLYAYTLNRSLRFLCTPDDVEDMRFLWDLGLRRIKIGSSNATNVPLLREVARRSWDVILSTGACSIIDVANAVGVLKRAPHLTLLHCVSAYPARLENMNLRAIMLLQSFVHKVGLSDHTVTDEAAVMALAMGASVIEKHLTLRKMQDGPDHGASYEPLFMKLFVDKLRHCERGLGDGCKRVLPCEEANRKEFDAFVARQRQRVPSC